MAAAGSVATPFPGTRAGVVGGCPVSPTRGVNGTGYLDASRRVARRHRSEATYESGASYLVVDTGPWIFGKKVMLPAGVIDRVDLENEKAFVSLTKDEIKNAPELDYSRGGLDDENRMRLGSYYGEPTYAGDPTPDRRL
jgi:hypothetical protein